MTLKDILQKANDKSSSEWQDLFAESRDNLRAWIQAHGELAAIFGFVSGILIVIFFKLFLWITFILFTIGAIFWLRSPDVE